jgi:hypothetical protein
LGAIDQLLALTAIAIFIGFILSIIDDTVYQVFEGRKWWPSWLHNLRTRTWQKHVRKLYDKAQNKSDPLFVEYWSELRQFPVDDENRPTAMRPTRMGNVLAAYEDYPSRRYGMDSVFYWYRLWLLVDKDTREEIDSSWVEGDAMLYMAFASAWLVATYAFVALVNYVLPGYPSRWPLNSVFSTFYQSIWPFSSVGTLSPLVGATFLLLVSMICVRISTPLMVRNGENYKSLFDVYRSRLRVLEEGSASEHERWERLSDRLQYAWPRPDLIPAGANKPGPLRRFWRWIRRR